MTPAGPATPKDNAAGEGPGAPIPAPGPEPWRTALNESLVKSRAFVLFLLKTILPLYVVTGVLVESGAMAWISGFLEPVMGIWGLPPEAAAVITAGMLVNLYAATAVAAPLGLSWQQVSVLGLMLGIAHSMLVEGVVVRQLLPEHHRSINTFRLVLGLLAGWLLHLALP